MSEDILSIYHRRLQWNPIDEGLVARQQETVREIVKGGRTPERALEMARSAITLADQPAPAQAI